MLFFPNDDFSARDRREMDADENCLCVKSEDKLLKEVVDMAFLESNCVISFLIFLWFWIISQTVLLRKLWAACGE